MDNQEKKNSRLSQQFRSIPRQRTKTDFLPRISEKDLPGFDRQKETDQNITRSISRKSVTPQNLVQRSSRDTQRVVKTETVKQDFRNEYYQVLEQQLIAIVDGKVQLSPEGLHLTEVYTLIKLLGKGGDGCVFLAKDKNLDILCAVKVIVCNQEKRRDNFFNEIRLTAKLRHPNIVGIFYANKIGECLYYVMEYIDGLSCDAILSCSKLQQEDVILIADNLAQALQYAHQNNIIHRDIKPANVMLQNKSIVKLLDLGLALTEQSSAEQQIAGTPYYMSPEQISGHLDQIDKRTDIYSYGATLYHMVTGRPPFKGAKMESTFWNIIDPMCHPTPPHEINSDVPEAFSKIILKCLQKQVDNRYQSMDEILEDLQKLK